MMTHMDSNRCFGRLKAQELTDEEMAQVGGGDISHQFYCWNQVSEGDGGNQACFAIGYGPGYCNPT